MRSAAAYWRGSEKNPQLQRHLRHRVGVAGRAEGVHLRVARRGGEARPPPARRRARPVLVPGRDRVRARGVPPQGRHRAPGDGGLLARSGTRRPATSSSTPRTSPSRRCSRSPGTWTGTPRACSRRWSWTRRSTRTAPSASPPQKYYLKPMNCPMHILIFKARGRSYRELPLRLFEFGIGLPVREVRRRARADPGARDDPGRRAHLLHQGADAGRARLAAHLRARPAARLRARRLLPRAVDPAAEASSSAPTRSGTRPPSSCATRPPSRTSSWCSTRAAARSTARRSRCRPGTRSAAPGRCRRSRSTSSCRSASSWSTRPPTAPGSGRS